MVYDLTFNSVRFCTKSSHVVTYTWSYVLIYFPKLFRNIITLEPTFVHLKVVSKAKAAQLMSKKPTVISFVETDILGTVK